MLLLKAIHMQLLPVYLPFNLEKDNKCDLKPLQKLSVWLIASFFCPAYMYF